MDKVVKKQWVEALRSGKYKQGNNYLCKDDSFCCLGVLLDTQKVPYETRTEDDDSDDNSYTYRTYMNGGSYLPIECSFGITDTQETHLVNMNDNQKKNFNEIADWIEENL